jgi:hypothetical protein
MSLPKKNYFSHERFRTYNLAFLFLFLFLGIDLIKQSNFIDPAGFYTMIDFWTLWAAAHFSLSGQASFAYDPNLLDSVIWNVDPFSTVMNATLRDPQSMAVRLFWFYPPTYLLLVTPLGFFPPALAALIYIFTTFSAYLLVIKKIVSENIMLIAFIAFPAIWMNLRVGQNGYLITGLFGSFLLLLPKYPRLSGICMGMLCIKPHLALMLPFALIAIGAWETLLVGFVTGLFLVSASIYFLGVAAWEAWYGSLSHARHILETAESHWNFSPSVFAFMRLLGAPLNLAYTVHLSVVALAAWIVWQVWRKSNAWPLKQATLVLATLLATPYIFDYDLTLLALPIALILSFSLKHGWMIAEREMLLLLWIMPLAIVPIAFLTGVQLGPMILLASLFLVARRAQAEMAHHQTD